jgi:hypothetical protein
MGDFNFGDGWKEEQSIDKEFEDSFRIHKIRNGLTEIDGYTMPPFLNFPAWRPDRILYRDNKNLKLLTFEIIGKDKIEVDVNESDPDSDVSTPSDHSGLYAKFNIN